MCIFKREDIVDRICDCIVLVPDEQREIFIKNYLSIPEDEFIFMFEKASGLKLFRLIKNRYLIK